jgi:hypothetical protein
MRRQRILLTVCMIALLLVVQPAAAAPLSEGAREASPSRFSAGLPAIQDVFVILMENHNWNEIKGSPSAPYMNNTLLPIAAHAEAYSNLPGIHPSLPNYLWLEAGTNFGVADDNPPPSITKAPPNISRRSSKMPGLRGRHMRRTYRERTAR